MYYDFWNKCFGKTGNPLSLSCGMSKGSLSLTMEKPFFGFQNIYLDGPLRILRLGPISLSLCNCQPTNNQLLRASLISDVAVYQNKFPKEDEHCHQVTSFLSETRAAFDPSNPEGHISVRAWILSHDKSKVLLIPHPNGHSLRLPSGVISTDDLCAVEATQRAFKHDFSFLGFRTLLNRPFHIEVTRRPSDEQRGEHTHFCLTYAFQCTDDFDKVQPSKRFPGKWYRLGQVGPIDPDGSYLRMSFKTLSELSNA